MRRMISNNIAGKLAVQDGKIGTYVDAGIKITINKSKAAQAGGKFTIATGVTSLDSVGTIWSDGGPGGAPSNTIIYDDDFGMVLANINGSDFYLQTTVGDAYVGEVVRADVCDAVEPTGKQFKAFKLED